MEFLFTLVVVALCFDNPTAHIKTAVSGLWLFILFMNFVLEPNQMRLLLSCITYAYLAAFNLFFTYFIAYPLTPFIVLCTPSSGVVPRWLVWFATFDAPADAGWRGGYFTNANPEWYARPWCYSGNGTPTGLNLFCLRCRWLWRNAAYGFGYWPMGIAYNPDDWTIQTCNIANGVLIQFKAVTNDGKYFCYTDSTGKKFGWKLWWALDLTTGHLIPAASYNQHNALPEYDQAKRLMFVFTP